jgi:hypothetical protein
MGNSMHLRVALVACCALTTVSACGGSAQDGPGQPLTQNPTVDAGPDASSSATGGAGSSGGATNTTEIPAPSTGEVTGQDPTVTSNSANVPLDDFDHATGNAPMLPEGIPGFVWSLAIGYWFQTLPENQVSDAIIDAVEPPRGDSAKACHLESASGPAHLWAQLNHPLGIAVDMSRYSALTFWSRVDRGASAIRVTLTAEGWITNDLDLDGALHTTLPISEGWQQWVISFDELGLGDDSIASIVFTPEGSDGPIDFWIDDLALLCRYRGC